MFEGHGDCGGRSVFRALYWAMQQRYSIAKCQNVRFICNTPAAGSLLYLSVLIPRLGSILLWNHNSDRIYDRNDDDGDDLIQALDAPGFRVWEADETDECERYELSPSLSTALKRQVLTSELLATAQNRSPLE